ncbi:MAG TPA: CBS domain-containing protein [Dehalococcoidia bacterium]|nr:CBS domain-containing protein [Dehalococcoidia bacterium]
MLARDLMSPSVITVHPQATVGEAARLMLENNVSCLPVVDDQGRLVGLLTHTDFGLHPKFRPLADNIYSLFGASTSPKHIQEVSQKVSGKLVKDVMHHPVTTVNEDTPIAEAMRLMLNQGIHRLPVMADGHLVGVITRHDFLKLIANS